MKKTMIVLLLIAILGCGKKLDLKPRSDLLQPRSLSDFESLLDNTDVMNVTPGLNQLASDEYFIPGLNAWNAIGSVTQRNAYLWLPDLYGAESGLKSWEAPYKTILYANSVLDELAKNKLEAVSGMAQIKGWALFCRAYAFYSLVSTFSKAYDSATANTDLGIPLKLNPDINEILGRSTVQQSYDQIISDALAASELLRQEINPEKKNRPSKVAAFALLARVGLSMRRYELAENYADRAMALYATLENFNTLQISNRSSFTVNSTETIYYTQQLSEYTSTTMGSNPLYGLDPALMALYPANDLRLKIYFRRSAAGHEIIKGINSLGFPFTGLATDELYLIKAECLARRQEKDQALSFLNTLVQTRVVSGTFSELTASTAAEALDLVLLERRKALVWRSLRWTDLKRLNLEGRNIVLGRNLNGQLYRLPANSPLYVMPIPFEEIYRSGIPQNPR